MRLGHCEHLRELALERIVAKRLMGTGRAAQFDDDRTVRRRPAMDVDRQVVEFREGRRIVGAVLRLSDLPLDDESSTDTSRKVSAAAAAPCGLADWADAWKIASPMAIE